MPVFKGKVSIIRFDEKGFTHALDRAVKEAYRIALKAFLKAALDRIPVKTGMARGSLRPLADFLGESIDLSSSKPTRIHNADAGADQTIFDMSEFEFPTYKVKIKIGTLHYKLHEYLFEIYNVRINRYVISEPWQSFEYGREAFKEALKANLKVPKMAKYFVRTEVPFGR